jgi:hypothetical protein
MPGIEYVLLVMARQGFPFRLRRYQHRYSRLVYFLQESLGVRDVGMNPGKRDHYLLPTPILRSVIIHFGLVSSLSNRGG